MTAATYARLRVTDPGRWRAAAVSWAVWADMAGRWAATFGPIIARFAAAWSGRAAQAASARLDRLRRLVNLFRVLCWESDQVLREFAAALERARALLARAIAEAARAGAVITDEGTVTAPPRGATGHRPGRPSGRGTDRANGGQGPIDRASNDRASNERASNERASNDRASNDRADADGAAFDRADVDGAALDRAVTDLSEALAVAERADATAAGRLGEVAAVASAAFAAPVARAWAADPAGATASVADYLAPPSDRPLPPCTATPVEVRRWWDGLTPAQRRWLTATHPAWLGSLDGVPAGFRDLANRMLLDERRAELDREIARAADTDRCRLDGLRRGLDELADRLRDEGGPRAYLMDLDLAGEGRVIVALGDPDRADNVLTHVPGMMAGLASHGSELLHAERVAIRATELRPTASTSAVMWLGYDAPDFLGEASRAGQARAGSLDLRRFEDGLRATHDGPPARQTVLGHSYGSLVVGEAAARPGLAADGVIFVASPGVGVASASQLHVPPGEVWSTTARSDIVRFAMSPRDLLNDVATAAALPPVLGPALALATPPEQLWFGRDPNDPAFGGHVFASQPDAGHVGYWDRGRPALDAIASIAVGVAR